MLKLRVLTGPRAGRLITVTDQEPVTIGRSTGRVRLHDSRVSKNHAQITWVDGAWVLRDLGSSNGSIINKGVLRGLAELEAGDLLQFGRVLIKVQRADDQGMDHGGGLPGALAAVSGGDSALGSPGSLLPGAALDDDDELDLDALFASQDGDLDDEEDEPFALPKPETAPEPRRDEPAPTKQAPRPESPLAPAAPPEEQVTDENSIFDQATDHHEDDLVADHSAATVVGGETDDPALSLDTSSTPADPDADLIQIEDETPDAGKLPGSTIVLPEPEERPPAEATAELSAPANPPSEAGVVAKEAEKAAETTEAKAPELEHDDARAGSSSSWDELFDQQAGPAENIAGIDIPDEDELPQAGPATTAPMGAAEPVPDSMVEKAKDADAEIEGEPEPEIASAVEAESEAAVQAELEPEGETECGADPTSARLAHIEADDQAHATDEAEAKTEPVLDEAAELAETSATEVPTGLASEPLDGHPEDIDVAALADPASGFADSDPEVEPSLEVEADLARVDEPEGEAEPAPAQAQAMEPAAEEASPPEADPAGEAAGDEPHDESLDVDDAAVVSVDAEAEDSRDDAEREPAVDDEDAGWSSLEDEPDAAQPVDMDEAMQPAVAVEVDEDEAASSTDEAFDIDAAFADLASGLDDEPVETADADVDQDSQEEPAATGVSQAPDSDTQADPPTPPENLAGSQIDVAFIQDALSKLPQVDDEQNPLGLKATSQFQQVDPEPVDLTDEPQEPAGSAAAVAEELLADDEQSTAAHDLHDQVAAKDEPSTSAATEPSARVVDQPPPGVNPVSLVQPEEPRSSRVVAPRKESIQRFLPAAIILLLVGGLSGFFIAKPGLITGKKESANPTPQQNNPPEPTARSETQDPPAGPEPSDPQADDPPVLEIRPDGQEPSQPPPISDESKPNPPDPGTASQPDPFAEGPSVIGEQALAGIGRAESASPPTDIPEQVAPPANPNNPAVNTDLPPLVNPNSQPNPDTPSRPGVEPANPGADTTSPPIALDGDRLVFLVDASGSLVDTLPQMIGWLNEALDNLETKEQFAIIFFKQGRAIEVPPAGIRPMTGAYRRALEREWLAPNAVPVLPAGRSDPTQAIELALSYNPSDIYLLSDESFAKSTGDMSPDQAVANVIKVLGETKVRVHGVQFFYQDQDQAGPLQLLAAAYNGTYEFVAEARLPDQDPIDLLEELENRNR